MATTALIWMKEALHAGGRSRHRSGSPGRGYLMALRSAGEVGQYPHDSPHMSILLDGDCLYLNTGNGVDNTHRKVGNPKAPSCIALYKNSGRLLARDNEGIGPRTFHESWSSPSLGVIEDRRLLFFGGPDGFCYAFKALSPPFDEKVSLFECEWRFDCDPEAPKEAIHDYVGNSKEGRSEIMGMPVVYKNRVYVVAGVISGGENGELGLSV